MRSNKLSLIWELPIPEEEIDADNIKATTQKYTVFPAQIRKWKLMITVFSSQTVRNTFQGCGYVYEEDNYYGMETENESEIDSNNR